MVSNSWNNDLLIPYKNSILIFDTDEATAIQLQTENDDFYFHSSIIFSLPDGSFMSKGAITNKEELEKAENSLNVEPIPCFIKYDSTGEITFIKRISDIGVEFPKYNSQEQQFIADSNGFIYYFRPKGDTSEPEIFVFTSEMELLFSIEMPDDFWGLTKKCLWRNDEGNIIFTYISNDLITRNDSTLRCLTISRNDKGFAKENNEITKFISMIDQVSDGEPLLDGNGELYCYNKIGVYSVIESENKLLFNWANVGIDANSVDNIIIKSHDIIYVVLAEDNDEYKLGKISLVPVSSVYGDDVETPPTLRLAIDQENNPYSARMLKYASSFVRSEKGCQVEIVSYSDTEGGLSANQKLARDISAGDQPDLVVFGGGLSYETLAKQDVFADIYGFIDADPDYDRSDFLGCVLSPFESSDGTLKRLVSEFAIQTMISGKNTVGELESMTLDDFAGFGSSLPDGQYLVSTISFDGKDLPERLLNNTLPVMLDEFVDFENGKCDFDGIRTLLDICTNSKILAVPGFTDPKSLAEKKLLFAPVYYFNLEYFMLDRYMSFPDGDIQYTGYPTTTGNQKNSAVYPVISTSIMKTSASQNTSWELIKYFIGMKEREAEKVTEARDVADLMNFPCTKKGIEGMITVARSYRFAMNAGEIENDDGSISSVISVNAYDLPEEESERVKKNSNLGLEVYFTDEDEKALWSLLDSAGRIYTKGSSVLPIITEEASSCFAGVKSIDDVVGLIQNRVNILINE